MQKILTAVLLVACIGLCKCDDEPAEAVEAPAPPKPPCSCILPLVFLPGGGVLPGGITTGILNNLLSGGILNNSNLNLSALKFLLANPSLLGLPGVSGLLNILLAGGALNAVPAGGPDGPIVGGLLNNLLAGGLLNSGVPGVPASGVTGGILNNALAGGVGNNLLPAALGILRGPYGGLLPGLLGGTKVLSDNSLLSSSVNTAIAPGGYAGAYGL